MYLPVTLFTLRELKTLQIYQHTQTQIQCSSNMFLLYYSSLKLVSPSQPIGYHNATRIYLIISPESSLLANYCLSWSPCCKLLRSCNPSAIPATIPSPLLCSLQNATRVIFLSKSKTKPKKGIFACKSLENKSKFPALACKALYHPTTIYKQNLICHYLNCFCSNHKELRRP